MTPEQYKENFYEYFVETNRALKLTEEQINQLHNLSHINDSETFLDCLMRRMRDYSFFGYGLEEHLDAVFYHVDDNLYFESVKTFDQYVDYFKNVIIHGVAVMKFI